MVCTVVRVWLTPLCFQTKGVEVCRMELSSPEKLAVMSETKKNLAQSEFINLKTLQLQSAAAGEASARMRAELIGFKELASVYAEAGETKKLNKIKKKIKELESKLGIGSDSSSEDSD